MLLLLLVVGAPAGAALPGGLSADEARCELALGPATDRLGAREATCLARCDRKVRAGRIPASDCAAPYAGPTATCVAAAQRLALRTMASGCRRDCPECYGGDCPGFESGAVAATGAVVGGLASDIFCGGAGSGDATVAICRTAAADALARVAVATGRCIVSCQRRVFRGSAAAGACTGDPIADARAAACIDRAVTRAGHRLDARCAGVGAALPPRCPPWSTASAPRSRATIVPSSCAARRARRSCESSRPSRLRAALGVRRRTT